MAAIQLRAYDQQMDEHSLLALWGAAFGADWPVQGEWLRQVILTPGCYLPGDHIIAEMDGELLGFALTQIDPDHLQSGSILALAVHPRHQHKGLGRRLHQAALARLFSRGALQVRLGSGAQSYFWPGVPANLPAAWRFFEAQGWQKAEVSYDMVRSLHDYHTPAWVWERLRGLSLRFVLASAQDAAAVSAFVSAEHAPWSAFFALAFQQQRPHDVILARGRSGEILGACLIDEHSERWAGCFPGPAGAPGCILTADRAREQGIGMALAARATETLRARGCLTSFLGWTWLVDWYGKLGYTIWQEYIISAAREITPIMAAGA